MSKEKVFYNIAELTAKLAVLEDMGNLTPIQVANAAALLAQAQQLAVISGHLGRIAACLEKLTGKVEELPDAPTT